MMHVFVSLWEFAYVVANGRRYRRRYVIDIHMEFTWVDTRASRKYLGEYGSRSGILNRLHERRGT